MWSNYITNDSETTLCRLVHWCMVFYEDTWKHTLCIHPVRHQIGFCNGASYVCLITTLEQCHMINTGQITENPTICSDFCSGLHKKHKWNPPETGGLPSHRASYALENVTMSWRHNVGLYCTSQEICTGIVFFLPEASLGLLVLLLPASVCVCVSVCVSMYRYVCQPWACP